MILIIREKATPEQLQQMLEVYSAEGYIKLAVDVGQKIAVGGAEMHYECEEVLLEAGSKQRDVWEPVGSGKRRKFAMTLSSTYAHRKPRP